MTLKKGSLVRFVPQAQRPHHRRANLEQQRGLVVKIQKTAKYDFLCHVKWFNQTMSLADVLYPESLQYFDKEKDQWVQGSHDDVIETK